MKHIFITLEEFTKKIEDCFRVNFGHMPYSDIKKAMDSFHGSMESQIIHVEPLEPHVEVATETPKTEESTSDTAKTTS